MYESYNNKQATYYFGVLALLFVILVTPIITPMANEIVNPLKKEEFNLIDYQVIQNISIDKIEIYVMDKYEDFISIPKNLFKRKVTEEPIEVEKLPEEVVEETVPETTAAWFPEETREPESKAVLKKGSKYVPEYMYAVQSKTPVTIPEPLSDTDMRNYIGYVNTDNYLYLGEYRITGYTPGCEHCCGSTHGITTSGNKAKIGYTVAAERNIPLGVTLYIEGYGFYVVQDRGNLKENTIDIASPTHESCYDITKSGVNVYVVPLDCTQINTTYDELNGGS